MTINLCCSCFLCGSTSLVSKKYLTLNSDSALRDIGYSIPRNFRTILSAISPRFARAYRPVLVNKNYFKRLFFAETALLVGHFLSFLKIPFPRIIENSIGPTGISQRATSSRRFKTK